MEEKILKKEDIAKLYEELSKDYNFYAPVKEKGTIAFKKVSDPSEIELTYYNTKVPPKEVIFPQIETLFEYKLKGGDIEIEEPKNLDVKNLIFGIRPCDAYSFKLLENFFGFGEFKDDLFLKRKENTTLIGIACNSPKQSCFCTSVGGHPHKKEDVDVILVDLEDKYLVESISDKGRDLVKKISWLSDASESDVKQAQELSKKAEESIKTKVNVKDIEKLLDPNFEHPIWEEISATCLGCGTCTFLCPTCTCFDVVDENDKYNNRGRRVRIWDTCQFYLYTLHTSGHNPRDSSIERCRNRIMHKFCYYPENYNLLGCVGCGRCVQLCPVNNDIRSIINKINEIEKEEKISIA